MVSKILNVDDSEFALLKLRTTLERAGFEVVPSASTVEEAIARIAEHAPDLVTLDVVMVGTDGIEGVRDIVRKFPKVKILMVSAMGQEGLIQQALANGAKGFIIKPYRDDELVREIKRILGIAER